MSPIGNLKNSEFRSENFSWFSEGAKIFLLTDPSTELMLMFYVFSDVGTTLFNIVHVCTVQQQYQVTFLLFQTDAHNYKIIGILKQLKFRLSLRHVSVHAGTIIRELFRA